MLDIHVGRGMTQNGFRGRWKGLCQLPLGRHVFLFPLLYFLLSMQQEADSLTPCVPSSALVFVSIVLTGTKVVSQAVDSLLLVSWSP